ncbi:BPSS1780 family membrane protein [Pseudaquabacterium rugosum]|uniref:BPSS1780 family membrane protein n=1 Tax=Pseudaquabacterium rugosum TaxID=2984194 RepID=A0ABU9B631_9BURK
MGLPLLTVAPARGLRWIAQGWALWRRRPLSLTGLLAAFLLLAMLLVGLVPLAGTALALALVPSLSLGYMVAARSLQAGGPVHAGQLFAGLRHPRPAQRRAQWQLAGAYALLSLGVMLLSDTLDGGRLQAAMAASADEGAALPDTDALNDDGVAGALLLRLGLTALLAVPFWHAPALVHWGGQGALQALFSSTVAVWRARQAFTIYLLTWGALVALVTPLLVLLLHALGGASLPNLLMLPLALVISAVFYATLWPSYVDCFGEPGAAGATSATPTAPDSDPPPADGA